MTLSRLGKYPFQPIFWALLYLLGFSWGNTLDTANFRPKSGIPEIDSLPLNDWKVDGPPLSMTKALTLSALIPGGGQFYGHHPVRGGFLLGMETLLFAASAFTLFVDVPRWDRQTRIYLDSADATAARLGLDVNAKRDLETWVGRARDVSSISVRQTDLANSELAWGLGLHVYGLADAFDIVKKSHEPNSPERSVSKAFYYGLVFPGGGQIYNHRLGKCGLLWMALGASSVSAWSRQNVVESLNRSVATARLEKSLGIDSKLEDLEKDRTIFRKRRNQYYWGMAVFYIYSIMDGMVDAALSDFDSPKRYALMPGSEPLSFLAQIRF